MNLNAISAFCKCSLLTVCTDFSHSHVLIPITAHFSPIPIPFPSHGWSYSHSHGNAMWPMGSRSFPFPCTSLYIAGTRQLVCVDPEVKRSKVKVTVGLQVDTTALTDFRHTQTHTPGPHCSSWTTKELDGDVRWNFQWEKIRKVHEFFENFKAWILIFSLRRSAIA